jgi:hypothetical protein
MEGMRRKANVSVMVFSPAEPTNSRMVRQKWCAEKYGQPADYFGLAMLIPPAFGCLAMI